MTLNHGILLVSMSFQTKKLPLLRYRPHKDSYYFQVVLHNWLLYKCVCSRVEDPLCGVTLKPGITLVWMSFHAKKQVIVQGQSTQEISTSSYSSVLQLCGAIWNRVELFASLWSSVWSHVEPCGTVWSRSSFMWSDLETREFRLGFPAGCDVTNFKWIHVDPCGSIWYH